MLHPYKITDVAGLLKKYFKDLPTLLFPEELWPEMKQIETIKELQDWEDVKIFQAIYQKVRASIHPPVSRSSHPTCWSKSK